MSFLQHLILGLLLHILCLLCTSAWLLTHNARTMAVLQGVCLLLLCFAWSNYVPGDSHHLEPSIEPGKSLLSMAIEWASFLRSSFFHARISPLWTSHLYTMLKDTLHTPTRTATCCFGSGLWHYRLAVPGSQCVLWEVLHVETSDMNNV